MKKETFRVATVALLILILLFSWLKVDIAKSIYDLQIEIYQKQNNAIERYKMYDVNLSQTLDGTYRTDQFYCVWVEDRPYNERKEVDYHEKCHDLVFQSLKTVENHFCYMFNMKDINVSRKS